ncbi:hypothetical protein L4C36_07315 [Photobacterium japonica]|uniref:hypothetical protein n=1 Tax=Photobacterium japonica TaxID=2910235 RepID=UPI003D0C8180
MKRLNKPRWLAILLFSLSLLYLIPEIIFNATLVDVAGNGRNDQHLLHVIELFGRTMSGIGVTLLVADVLLKGRWVRTTTHTLCHFALIAAVVWPTVFWGQKWAVDTFLIHPSTPQARQDAFFSSVLRSGLAVNAVEIQGIPYDPNRSNSATEMTFLTMIGGLIFAQDDFIDHVSTQKHAILDRYITNHAGRQFDHDYARYVTLRTEVREAWADYHRGSTEYNRTMASANRRANTAWDDANQQIQQGWQDYQSAHRAYEKQAGHIADKFAPQLYELLDARNQCNKRSSGHRLESCLAKIEKKYQYGLRQAQLPYRDMDYWLIERINRTRGETSVKETMMTLGLSALLAAVEIAAGDAGEKDVQYYYTNDPSDYQPKILALWNDKFKQKTGYPLFITSNQTFRNHVATANTIRDKMSHEGVTLSPQWRIHQVSAFKQAVELSVRQQANTAWQQQVNQSGMDLSPNKSWTAFQVHPDIQGKIEAEMGERYYVKPILSDWNKRQFYQHVVKVNIDRERKYWLTYIQSASAQFADGRPFAEDGKAALRSIIVPPISMSLSLLLILLTIIKLPLKLWQLVHYDTPVTPVEKRNHQLITAGLIALMMISPVLVGSSKFTEQRSAVSYFLEQFDDTVSPVSSIALKWVLHTQPLVQPLGATLENHLAVIPAFDRHLQPSLTQWDNLIMASLYGNTTTPATHTGPLPFTVTSNAPHIKVRIMNIRPSYQAGMTLPQGSYDIDVSAPGYQSVRQWVNHNTETSSHHIALPRR